VNYYPYILIPAAGWIIAQLIKFSWSAFRGKIDVRNLYASGGMPSGHSAVVTALALTIYLNEGIGSAAFGIAVIYAGIVMYDALGVRRASGEQAAALNELIDSLGRHKIAVDLPQDRLREVMGHTPKEVAAGALLGAVLAGLFNYDKITGLTNYLSTAPGRRGLIAFAILGAGLLIGGVVFKLWSNMVHKGSASWRNLSRDVLIQTQLFGWLGLIIAFFAYEHAAYLSWRMWSFIIYAIAVIWLVRRSLRAIRELPPQLNQEQERARVGKWLEGSKRKRSKRSKSR
jgi:acid phosphatase family membrane protein YuiD